jgi:hypothetical protein
MPWPSGRGGWPFRRPTVRFSREAAARATPERGDSVWGQREVGAQRKGCFHGGAHQPKGAHSVWSEERWKKAVDGSGRCLELRRCLPTRRRDQRALASGRSSADMTASIAHLSGAASMTQRRRPGV